MENTVEKTRKFTLLQLFSIVDGRLSTAGMDSVYDILGYVSGYQQPFTHQLPGLMDELKTNKPV